VARALAEAACHGRLLDHLHGRTLYGIQVTKCTRMAMP
jgi:hypothetical protein